MYIEDTLYNIYKRQRRKNLLDISKRLSISTGKNRVGIICDMIRESLFNGAMFTEYDDLDFIHRDKENRKTYITTFYEFKLYDQLNPKELRNLFHDKICFLKTFQELITREWLDISHVEENVVSRFIAKHRRAVLKASYGDSGKEVAVVDIPENMTSSRLKELMESKGYNLIEECLSNCELLASLNQTSLNSIRIVTINKNKKISFLFAGLRVGAKDSVLDNISQGASVARIDLETGKINSPFYTKRSAHSNKGENLASREGLVLPYWNEVKDLAKNAATVVPEMGIVAWDICITEKGPEIIEGNESFGCVIMQLYYKYNEEGLKPLLLKLLDEE